MTTRANVGVRELRQNLSVYLRRVQRGESLEVTARGRPVALLSPLRERADTWDRLLAEGRLIPASDPGGALPEPVAAPDGPSISEILEEIRADRV